MAFKLRTWSSHPAAPDDDDEEQIPWVLLEEKAYIADRRNDTTAFSSSRCGRGDIQISFFVAPPPRVSYLCVYCRHRRSALAGKEMIPVVPHVISTDDNFILLRIIVSPERDLDEGEGLYIYRPAGEGGPSLKVLDPPPRNKIFSCYQVAILSGPTNRREDHDGSSSLSFLRPHRAREEKFYMVAALCDDEDAPGHGRFDLYLYNSKLGAWAITKVSVEDLHFQKYQDEGYFHHQQTNVIVIGGEDNTIAFVDLWRGILLCDLSHVEDKPWLRYVPLPEPLRLGLPIIGDARHSRDIAVDKGCFKCVEQLLYWKACPVYGDDIIDGWTSTLWTRPVSANALLDDTWETVCSVESLEMDIESNPDFQLLPKLADNEGRPLAPFQRLHISQPTLVLDAGHTVCFMVKIDQNDDTAWVIAVDMMYNRLQGVAEFSPARYAGIGISYFHSRISKYMNGASGTKGTLKRPGGMLLPSGSINKKQPGILKTMQTCWDGEHKQQDAEMEGMAEDGGNDMLLE